MSASTPRIVVVGNGTAGLRFTQELHGLLPGAGITVVGDEPGGAYNRARLPLVLAGMAREDSIELADASWYAARGIRLVTAAARRIDRAARLLEAADGQALPYDTLVLATGSAPMLPGTAGLAGPGGRLLHGAAAFRTLADCAEIRALAGRAERAAVLGGGVLGLGTARALAAGGLPVTLLQRGPRLMERQLDSGAARVLTRTARGLGVTVRTGAVVREVRGPGRVREIVLAGGDALGTDLLVLCCGTRPRTELARAAGLAVGAGVVVDDQMRSITDPAVFAVGDCAEHRGRIHGLIAPAWAQARAAARAVAGHDSTVTSSPGMTAVIRAKAAGIELAVLGSARGGGRAEVVRFTDPSRGIYQKLVVRDGRPARIPGNATICQCNGVTKAAICAAWQDGARDAGQVATRTRAATGCGTCRDTLEGIVGWLAAAEPGLVPA